MSQPLKHSPIPAPTSAQQSPETAPRNIEAEQALIGALLFDNEAFHNLGAPLRPEHFYDPVHARLFGALGRLIDSGRTADAIILQNQFADDAGLKDLGGTRYLAELVSAAAPSAVVREYANYVYDLAIRRELMRLGSEISENARTDGETEVIRQLENAERRLFSLAETGRSEGGFQTFSDALSASLEAAQAAFEREGSLSGLSTGLIDLDRQLGGLHPSDLIILAGRPSMGKTSLATNIAFNIARAFRTSENEYGEKIRIDGGRVGFFSLEMSADQLATRLLAEFSEIASHRIRRGDIEAHEFDQLVEAVNALNVIPLHIDDTGGISISQLAARARRLKRQAGLDVLIVDYLQLVTTSGSKRTDNRVQEVSEITQGLKALAKELSIPVIALSQLSRNVENRDDKRPQLSDLRESGSIEQDADVVMFVFREAYYVSRSEPKSREGTPEYEQWLADMERVDGKAEVIIGKQRHGPIGTVELGFIENLTKFTNLDTSGRYDSSVH